MKPRVAVALLCTAAVACGPKTTPPPPPPPPTLIHTTYRAMAGLSMGAIGTAGLGFSHADRFDAFGVLGGPLDAPMLLRLLDHFFLGGFCSRADIEAVMAADPTRLNDPTAFAACLHPTTPIAYEHAEDFSHFVYSINAGFDRTGYFGLFTDLTLAFGNLLTQNEDSPFAPPGADAQHMQRPPSDFCTNPLHVKGLKNLEYNADGKYDAITFCDGEQPIYFCNSDQSIVDFCSDPANIATPLPYGQQATFAAQFCAGKGGTAVADTTNQPDLVLHNGGIYDPCREPFYPVQVALAYDYNGNGRRDFGEPLVDNGAERFQDVGVDGCADALEDGHGGCGTQPNPSAVDPNHDNYDALTNALGTENNWRYDEGEPFADDGLDGVPGTQDTGEGNAVYDMTPGRRALYAHDPRTLLGSLDAATIARINLLLDGGIRDVFNFGLTAQQVFGRFSLLRPSDSARYRDFVDIPGMADARTGAYSPWTQAWRRAPKNPFIFYGTDNPTDQQLIDGDGDHVGTNAQAVDRISTLFAWVASQWPSLPRPSTPLNGLGYDQRQQITSYDSQVLGAKRDFGIYLPPGYELPENQDAGYPVLYLLHGYEGDPTQILPSTLLPDTYMQDTDVRLTPMIVVAPSGACCFVNATTGARDCREVDDAGVSLSAQAGWERECIGGSFFFNQIGAQNGVSVPYADSFFELMDYVDKNYRTLPAADVEQR